MIMKLRHDPYKIFRGSKTPAGLYARQKWLGQAQLPGWQADFEERVDELFDGQSTDGSWGQSPLATIDRLFGLHLTMRAADHRIDAGLDWLMDQIRLGPEGIGIDGAFDIKLPDLQGLPFAVSRPEMVLTGAALFLSSIFNRQYDPKVLSLYQWLCRNGLTREGLGADTTALHNIFRALVVHSDFAHHDLTAKTVGIYAGFQTDCGDWGPGLPFYQVLNALAHLDSKPAEGQLEPAFARLAKTQNNDGTWGRHQPEWHTFLAIHALKNKGLL